MDTEVSGKGLENELSWEKTKPSLNDKFSLSFVKAEISQLAMAVFIFTFVSHDGKPISSCSLQEKRVHTNRIKIHGRIYTSFSLLCHSKFERQSA
jgi:hypothetical protein